MATLLDQFTDFMLATRPTPLSGTEDILTECTKYRTYLIRRMMAGLTKEETIQSGTKVVDFVRLANGASSYKNFKPTDTFQFSGTNSLTQLEIPWRYSLVSSVWNEIEIALNSGGDQKSVFKNIKKNKQIQMEQDLWEGIEDSLWATPDTVKMESGDGDTPYSLLAFVTDDGLAPSGTNGGDGVTTGVVGSNWTSVMTASPTTFANWRNQYETYDSTNATTKAGASGIIPAMDNMWLDVQFESPSTSQQYFTDTVLSKMMIVTNKEGYNTLVNIASNRNDRLASAGAGNDLGYSQGKISYHGIPIQYIAALDSIDTAGKPRYRFYNFKHIKPIFQKQGYMTTRELPATPGNFLTKGMAKLTYRQLWCSSRRQQGVVRAA